MSAGYGVRWRELPLRGRRAGSAAMPAVVEKARAATNYFWGVLDLVFVGVSVLISLA